MSRKADRRPKKRKSGSRKPNPKFKHFYLGRNEEATEFLKEKKRQGHSDVFMIFVSTSSATRSTKAGWYVTWR